MNLREYSESTIYCFWNHSKSFLHSYPLQVESVLRIAIVTHYKKTVRRLQESCKSYAVDGLWSNWYYKKTEMVIDFEATLSLVGRFKLLEALI